MVRAWLMVGVSLWAACATLPDVDACDPGLVTARLQAKAIECRALRMRECPGVRLATFEANPETCPVVAQCYREMDQDVFSCVNR